MKTLTLAQDLGNMVYSLAALRRRIVDGWEQISAEARKRGVVYTDPSILPKAPKLLGSSIKVEKGLKKGVVTAVLYGPPASSAYAWPSRRSAPTTCPWSTEECRKSCLVGSGQLSMQPNSRLWKETLRRGAPELYHALLQKEISALARKAKRLGKRAAIRLDGTTDLGLARSFAGANPTVQFYDYTKSVRRATGVRPTNWHVTFSFSGHNREEAKQVLAGGGNVAVVFQAKPPRGKSSGDPLPSTWEGYPVLNGDDTDIRFDDPSGHVVGLSLKGTNKWEARVAAAGVFAEPIQKTGTEPCTQVQ